jgi:transcriptional regulator with XRE-family HTH domain
MEHAGRKLRLARKRLNMRVRDVEQASLVIAEKHRNDEFAVLTNRISEIENRGLVPTVYKLYSLCAIYRLDVKEVLDWYGVPLFASSADNGVKRFEREPVTHAPKPPLDAEWVLHMIVPPKKCDDQVNSLEQLYVKKYKRIEKKRADIWYCKQVLGLVWRQLFERRTKITVKMICWLLRLLGLGNVADALAQAANEATAASRPPRRRRP